jgi:hypothetical protein
MNKLLTFLFLIYSANTFTQSWSVDYSSGFSTYYMEDLKDFLQSMNNTNGLKVTDNFPGYITHSLSFGYSDKGHQTGSNFTYLTTGGRLHRSDYSGSYTVDMILNAYRTGVYYRNYIFSQIPDLYFYLQLGSGIILSRFKINEKIIIYDESLQENMKLNSVGFYLEPLLGASYAFTDRIKLSISAGYEVNIPGYLYLAKGKTEIKAQWDGYRVYGGLTYVFVEKK